MHDFPARSETASFPERIESLLNVRDGAQAVYEYVHRDPEQRFATLFNATMVNVPARQLEQAYLRPQRALAEKIRSGRIATFRQLVGMAEAVLIVTAMSLRNKAYRQERRVTSAMESQTTRSEVPSIDLDQFSDGRGRPSERLEIEDAGRVLRAAIRTMGRLAFQAYRRVCHFERQRGTRHGAYTYVAGLAVLDRAGAIRGFRRTTVSDQVSTATVRDVTRLVRRAESCLRA